MKRIMIAPLAVGALAAGLLVPASANAQQKETFSVSGTLSGRISITI